PIIVIVMPDADSSFYMNSFDGKVKFEDFFFKEFLPHVEKTNRIIRDKRYRGVAGLSMGGYGAMLYALKHPDMFTATAPLSAAFLDDSSMVNMPKESWNMPMGALYGTDLVGKDRLTPTWYQNSIHELIRLATPEQLRSVRYWI